MSRYFPRFRYMDVCVLGGLLGTLTLLSWQHPADHIWRDSWFPGGLIVLYAVISWTKR